MAHQDARRRRKRKIGLRLPSGKPARAAVAATVGLALIATAAIALSSTGSNPRARAHSQVVVFGAYAPNAWLQGLILPQRKREAGRPRPPSRSTVRVASHPRERRSSLVRRFLDDTDCRAQLHAFDTEYLEHTKLRGFCT